MKGLLVLFMTITLSACSSTGHLKDSSREVGKEIRKELSENHGKGPKGPGPANSVDN